MKGDPEIIKRFQHLMRQKNLTQTEIAERLRFSRTYISSIIAGRSDFSGAFLKALAFDGWPITWILTGQSEDQSTEDWKTRAERAEEKLKLLDYHVQRLEKLVKK